MTITIVMTFELKFYVLPTEVYYYINHGNLDFFYFRSHDSLQSSFYLLITELITQNFNNIVSTPMRFPCFKAYFL
jgi:hypothetical protein